VLSVRHRLPWPTKTLRSGGLSERDSPSFTAHVYFKEIRDD
jgi:hypothetical protein